MNRRHGEKHEIIGWSPCTNTERQPDAMSSYTDDTGLRIHKEEFFAVWPPIGQQGDKRKMVHNNFGYWAAGLGRAGAAAHRSFVLRAAPAQRCDDDSPALLVRPGWPGWSPSSRRRRRTSEHGRT